MSRHMGPTAAFGLGFLLSCLALSGNSQDAPAKDDQKVRDPAVDATRPTGRPTARRSTRRWG